MAVSQTTSDLVLKSAVIGATASITAMAENSFLYGGKISSTIPVFGQQIPFPILLGGAFFVANFLGELAHQHIMPHVHVSERLSSYTSTAIAVGASWGALMLLLNMVRPELIEYMGMWYLLGTVLAVEAIGSYAYSTVVYPMMVQK